MNFIIGQKLLFFASFCPLSFFCFEKNRTVVVVFNTKKIKYITELYAIRDSDFEQRLAI